MFFLSNIDATFRRKKGSKNKYKRSNNYKDISEKRENINTARKVVGTGTNVMKEVRGWLKFLNK